MGTPPRSCGSCAEPIPAVGFAAWIEFLLLRRGMRQRIGRVEMSLAYFAKLWASAILAAGLAWGLRLAFDVQRPVLSAFVILPPYGLAYLGLTTIMGIDQAGNLARRFWKARKRL